MLPTDQRRAIEQKAVEQVAALATVAPQLVGNYFLDEWPDQEIDRLTEHFTAWPCPALEQDGTCRIYECRPLVCRSMGIPSDDNGQVNGACAVQTAVPLIQPSKVLREEEFQLARLEAERLEALRRHLGAEGEELFLPYAFVPDFGMEKTADTT
jgi:Fe-S-cluster containining protein